MNGSQLSLIAGAGSALLLLAAFGFQALGYAPCELCILQRWPHLFAVIIAVLILLTGHVRGFAMFGLFAAGTAMALGIYHAGVELSIWAGPSHCSGGVGKIGDMSTQDLMARLQEAPVVRCDEIAWSFLGISMAGWNAICSACLTVLWGIAAIRKR